MVSYSVLFQVGANAGIIGMTKEHLGLALALQVPVFVVVTKIDMCPANVLEDTLKLLQRILKSPGCRKMPVLVQNHDDVVCSATNFSSERYPKRPKYSDTLKSCCNHPKTKKKVLPQSNASKRCRQYCK